jgi:hypothetical protein
MPDEFPSRNEGKTLEFKENAKSMQGIVKTIIAFANTNGVRREIRTFEKVEKQSKTAFQPSQMSESHASPHSPLILSFP